jgi:hypothetical protein
MAKKDKQDINPEQFNEFLTYVAQKGPPPGKLSDIFDLSRDSGLYDIYKEDNPLIKSYKFTGANFINKLLQDKTNFNLTNDDKKLIIEVGAFGDPDPRSGFKLNMSDPKIADRVEKMSVDLAEQKEKLSNDEYQSYRAKSRKQLVNDVLKFKVADTVFDNEAPKLDFYARDKSKPFSDFITQELNMQSGYGFTPEIPDFAGGTIGKEYIPANDQERYRTKTYESEVFPTETIKTDRLENFYLDEELGYLRGPEGLFYNPETEQFLNQQDVYGPPPELKGYQYDPRLQGVLSEGVNPTYGSQFQNKNQGGLIGYAKGGQMNIKQQTQNVANQGRYGDSMLLHVNPAEVKGLAQAMPITVNPQTGQPEAFLPFLAPLLGSMAGTALFGGSALAAGIGAGLATYAQTGGSGSKALLSGLTAGFGTNALNTGAAASAGATAGTNAATNAATQGLDFAGQTAASQTANAAAQAAYQPQTAFSAGKDIFRGGFDQGAKSLATGLMSPSGMVAGASLGTQGVMNSQELFEQQMRELEMNEEQRRRDMYANNPEVQLYSASGGTTNFEGGGLLEKTLSGDYGVLGILKNNPELAFGAAGIAAKNNFRGSFLGELYNKYKERKSQGDEQGANEVASQIQQEESNQMAYGGLTQFRRGGSTDDDQYSYQSSRQVYAPAKTQYQVNPDFMAGFAPETMYFRPDTINAPSMSTLGGSRPTLGADTYTGTKGGYDYEGSVDADGNYTAGTAQGVQFAPQTSIDPYAAFTGSAPQGLVQSAYNPYPVQPMSMSPIDDTEDTSDYTDAGGIGEGGGDSTGGGGLYDGDQGYFSDLNLMGGNMGGFDPTSFMGASAYLNHKMFLISALDSTTRFLTNQYIQNQQIQEYLDSLNNPTTDIGDAFTADGPMGKAQGGVTNYANQGQTEIMPMDVMPEASAQTMQDPLIQEVTMFILGESDNEQAVNQFVDKYGVEAFSQLREQILQSLVPGAQTEGLIAGVGNGGMDDDIMGTIGNKEKIAVSQDEFIVPADVVSMLGDGSSDAGSKELYGMMDRVRQKKTGTTKQAPRLANAGGYLPA